MHHWNAVNKALRVTKLSPEFEKQFRDSVGDGSKPPKMSRIPQVNHAVDIYTACLCDDYEGWREIACEWSQLTGIERKLCEDEAKAAIKAGLV